MPKKEDLLQTCVVVRALVCQQEQQRRLCHESWAGLCPHKCPSFQSHAGGHPNALAVANFGTLLLYLHRKLGNRQETIHASMLLRPS